MSANPTPPDHYKARLLARGTIRLADEGDDPRDLNLCRAYLALDAERGNAPAPPPPDPAYETMSAAELDAVWLRLRPDIVLRDWLHDTLIPAVVRNVEAQADKYWRDVIKEIITVRAARQTALEAEVATLTARYETARVEGAQLGFCRGAHWGRAQVPNVLMDEDVKRECNRLFPVHAPPPALRAVARSLTGGAQ